jgi:hypothetical protein
MPKLEAIPTPKGFMIQLAYFVSKRVFGKVIAPISIIYARCFPLIYVAMKIDKVEMKLSLSRDEVNLIKSFVAQANNCTFCSDLSQYLAHKNELTQDERLCDFRANPAYSERTKAMLEYVDEVNATRGATQSTFDRLKQHFSEKEIVEVTWVCAAENYFNFLAKPLGLTSDSLSIDSLKKQSSNAHELNQQCHQDFWPIDQFFIPSNEVRQMSAASSSQRASLGNPK